jgi:hypothetical protein
MGYYDVFLLTQDTDFQGRVTACYAGETLSTDGGNPGAWTAEHIWKMASQPDFGDAYAYAIATDKPKPGADPSVITDAQLLSAVQSLI